MKAYGAMGSGDGGRSCSSVPSGYQTRMFRITDRNSLLINCGAFDTALQDLTPLRPVEICCIARPCASLAVRCRKVHLLCVLCAGAPQRPDNLNFPSFSLTTTIRS